MTLMTEYRSGSGKVITVGDFIAIDGKAALYRVTSLADGIEGVTVTAYGGKPGRLLSRTVTIDRASLRRKGELQDPNGAEREALAGVARASKAGKR